MTPEQQAAIERVENMLWPSDQAVAMARCGDLRLLVSLAKRGARLREALEQSIDALAAVEKTELNGVHRLFVETALAKARKALEGDA